MKRYLNKHWLILILFFACGGFAPGSHDAPAGAQPRHQRSEDVRISDGKTLYCKCFLISGGSPQYAFEGYAKGANLDSFWPKSRTQKRACELAVEDCKQSLIRLRCWTGFYEREGCSDTPSPHINYVE